MREREAEEAEAGAKAEAEAKSRSASAPHLENCTGETKHPAEASSAEGTERDRKRGMRKRTQKEPSRHEEVLGVARWRNWQDQAKKSAGWMPGH